jgi:hypothetical protein
MRRNVRTFPPFISSKYGIHFFTESESFKSVFKKIFWSGGVILDSVATATAMVALAGPLESFLVVKDTKEPYEGYGSEYEV